MKHSAKLERLRFNRQQAMNQWSEIYLNAQQGIIEMEKIQWAMTILNKLDNEIILFERK